MQGLVTHKRGSVRLRWPSVGSVGCSYDSALAETIKGFFKAEVIYRLGPWRNFDAVRYATVEWQHGDASIA